MTMKLNMRRLSVRAAALMSLISLAIAFESTTTVLPGAGLLPGTGLPSPEPELVSNDRSRSAAFVAGTADSSTATKKSNNAPVPIRPKLSRRASRDRVARFRFTLPIVPNIELIARTDNSFSTDEKDERSPQKMTRRMHPQLSPGSHNRLAE
jgi:hypothetical protein